MRFPRALTRIKQPEATESADALDDRAGPPQDQAQDQPAVKTSAIEVPCPAPGSRADTERTWDEDQNSPKGKTGGT